MNNARWIRAIFVSLAVLGTGGSALAQSESEITLPRLGRVEWLILWAVLASAFIALAYGYHLVRKVLREDPGLAKMVEVSTAIEEGAMAYLGRQFRTMIWFVVALTIVLFLVYQNVYPDWKFPAGIAAAFLMGVMASYGAGYAGFSRAITRAPAMNRMAL